MLQKLKTRLIECHKRGREVEVTYMKTGGLFSWEYNIVSCPAMYDSPSGCDQSCKPQLTLGSAFNPLQYRH